MILGVATLCTALFIHVRLRFIRARGQGEISAHRLFFFARRPSRIAVEFRIRKEEKGGKMCLVIIRVVITVPYAVR